MSDEQILEIMKKEFEWEQGVNLNTYFKRPEEETYNTEENVVTMDIWPANIVRYLMQCEKIFKINIKGFYTYQTVGDMVSCVKEHLDKHSSVNTTKRS